MVDGISKITVLGDRINDGVVVFDRNCVSVSCHPLSSAKQHNLSFSFFKIQQQFILFAILHNFRQILIKSGFDFVCCLRTKVCNGIISILNDGGVCDVVTKVVEKYDEEEGPKN